MRIKYNEAPDTATKDETSMSAIFITRLSYPDNYTSVRRARNSEWQ